MKRRVLAFTLYLLMVAGVSAGIGWFALTDALDRLEERAGSDLSLASDRLTGQLQRFRELAVSLADHPVLTPLVLSDAADRGADRTAAQALLVASADRTGSIEVAVLDPEGRVIVSSLSGLSGSERNANTPYFRRAMQGALGFQHAVDADTGTRMFLYAAPIFSPDGPVCGAVVVRHSVDRIEANWRDARAYRPLTAMLRQDPDFLDFLIGDAVTEGTARVIAGVCDGDLMPIFSVLEDPAADEYARGQMIDALVIIARDRPESRPDVVDYLERFPSADFDKPQTLCGSWAFAVADLGLVLLEPQVREAFEQEWISPDEVDFSFFQAQLRKAVEAGESPSFHISRNTRMIESAIDELSRWHCFSDKLLENKATTQASESSLSQLFSDTFEHVTPKVGRNDLCPCGSGKKYKKCCLQ